MKRMVESEIADILNEKLQVDENGVELKDNLAIEGYLHADGKISGREYTATFSTQHVNTVDAEILESMDMTAVFGSVKCNFENAVVNHDIVINTNATFGSIEIIAPKGVQIVTKSTSVFGGVSDKTETVQQDAGLPRIYINATCLFGGVDVL